ncbi:MAG: sigma-70 family RNA polymerase sigma factor [Anaerolineaceae bacterium]
MDKTTVRDKANEVAGKAKTTAGKASGNDNLEGKGQSEAAKVKMQSEPGFVALRTFPVIRRTPWRRQFGWMSDYSLAEDTDLVFAIGAGQDAALSVLYDRLHRRCFAFSVRILGAEGDAEEAVQETFVRVWRNAGQYDRTKAGVGSWVLSITRNLCRDELRRRRRRVPQLPTLDDALDLADPERTDVSAERAILSGQVRGAVQSLGSEQRSAIELVYFHGLSSREVGAILGVPAPTVRSRLRLALLKLGAVLEPQWLVAVD